MPDDALDEMDTPDDDEQLINKELEGDEFEELEDEDEIAEEEEDEE